MQGFVLIVLAIIVVGLAAWAGLGTGPTGNGASTAAGERYGGAEAGETTPDPAMVEEPGPDPTEAPSASGASSAAAENQDIDDLEREKKQAEEELAPRDKKADAEEIGSYQKALARRLKATREDAEQGDLFTPRLVAHLRQATEELLSGEKRTQVLATLIEENPGPVEGGLEVNMTYPKDDVSTVPPSLLERFPELPEGIEYRFVGCQLILLDRDARLILDFIPDCLW